LSKPRILTLLNQALFFLIASFSDDISGEREDIAGAAHN
jgi:hypothetical protein